jgi:vitamin B12 transporter
VTDNWEVEGLIRYTEGKVQFDEPRSQAGVFFPFEAQNFTNSQILLTSLENKWGTECADHSLKASYSQTNRKTDTPFFHNATTGEHPFLVYKTEVKLNSQNSTQLGLDGGQERAKEPDMHKRTHGGVFLIHAYKPFMDTTVRAGVRGDHYESLGSRVTFSVGVEQNLTCTTLFRTSLGTNFKPPVLSDLFQRTPWQVPNPFLKPEKSQSFEAGIDQVLWEEKMTVGLTGFMTRIDQITLSKQLAMGAWQRFNGGRRIAKGGETALSLKPVKTLEVKVALTFTQAHDFPNREKSPFIPEVKGALGANWQIFPDFSIFAQLYGVTTRKDSVTKKNLTPYGLVNIGSTYDVNAHANLFWRIENLTDKRFEEVYGYGVRGRAFFFGIEAKT